MTRSLTKVLGSTALVALAATAMFASSASALQLTPSNAAQRYTLTAELTSFRTWVIPGDDRTVNVNSDVFFDSGNFAGTGADGRDWNWSNTVLFAPGTRSVDFAYGGPNNFSVTPAAPVTVDPGVNFTFGSLSYTNGQWYPLAELGVSFSATPEFGLPHVYTETVMLITNDPLRPFTPEQQADYFYFLNHPELGSVRVYDAGFQPASRPGNVGTVDFITKIGSLDPVRFVSTNPGAFVNGSSTDVLAPSTTVPEPATLGLLGLGLVGVGVARRRRQT